MNSRSENTLFHKDPLTASPPPRSAFCWTVFLEPEGGRCVQPRKYLSENHPHSPSLHAALT